MRKMFSLDEIVTAVGGRVVNAADGEIFVSGISKDTRTIEEGNLYLALKGENFDGHSFCSDAVSKGAVVVLVSDESSVPAGTVGVVVDDTLEALGKLATAYRFKIGAKVVAVTGSVGKTSTREMIAGALGASFKVYSTKRNENNEIGLPMTILTAPEDTEVFVLEMGMRLRGEISYLTNIAHPDIAVITNVGHCHIERLGSRDEIALAKLEIREGIVPGGKLLINADDDFLCAKANQIVEHGIDVCAVVIGEDGKAEASKYQTGICSSDIAFCQGIDFGAVIAEGDNKTTVSGAHLNLSGMHNVRNALFGLLCTKLLGGDLDAAVKALADFKEMKGRGAVIEGKKFTVIDDAYNAAPESMAAAFFNLNAIAEGKRKIAVLGGMLELGDYAPMLHKYVGEECGKYHFDHIFVTGECRDDFVEGLLSVDESASYTLCDDTDDVYDKLIMYAQKDDVILFKASNAFGFQKLAQRASEEE